MMRATVIIVFALGIGACASSSIREPQRTTPADASRQIMLTVHQAASPSAGRRGRGSGGRYSGQGGYRATGATERTLDQLALENGLERIQGWPIRSLEVYCEVLEVPEGVAVESMIAQLSADPRVDLVQRMNIFQTLLSRYDDPYGEIQLSVRDLGIEQAHTFTTGQGVTIAVIDSSVDARHRDLDGRVSVAHDLVESPEAPRRGEVHGTAVAGIIASVVNNSEGIIGVAPDAEIAALRACWPVAGDSGESHCSSYTLAMGLEIALTIEPDIINLSLAGPFDPIMSLLLDKAIEQGIVVVAADSELNDQVNVFPASHPRVIVAHSRSTRTSNPTPYVLAAPATEILTTTPGSGYAFLSGNSLAAAHVSGVIALLMEADPEIDIETLAALLTRTSVESGDQTTIHAYRALATLIDRDFCDAQIATF